MIYAYLAYAISLLVRFTGYFLYGYLVLIAEALHSMTDILVLIVLKISSKVSEKPADLHHPLGHGLAGNVGALIAGVAFISILSYELFKEGVSRLFHHEVYSNPTNAIVLMLLSLVPLLVVVIYTQNRRLNPEEVALRYELRNDMLSGFSAVIALAFSGVFPQIDAIAAIVVAVIIAYSGLRLINENAKVLLGYSPNEEFYRKVARVASEFDEVKDVHDIIATYMAPDKVHLDMHVTVDGEMKVRDADALTEKIFDLLSKEVPEVEYATIHICAEGKKRLRTTYDKIIGDAGKS
ncbi:cation diffusion facilitator family transporter [Geoglobus sp.]